MRRAIPTLLLSWLALIPAAGPFAQTLSIDDVTQPEGNVGTTDFVFTVTLDAVQAFTVSVKPARGAVLTITRTTPVELKPVVDLS